MIVYLSQIKKTIFVTLSGLFKILDSKERKSLYVVFLFLFAIGIFEIIGVASIIPIISIMNDPEILNTNKYLINLKKILEMLGVQSTKEVLVLLGVGSFSIIAFSTVLRSYGLYLTTQFIEMRRHEISYKLLSGYLRNDFDFFLNSQSSELAKTVLSEVDRIVAQLVRPIITMVSYTFLLIFILAFLLFVNAKISLTIIFVFGGLYSFLYIAVRKKANYLGEQTVSSNRERFAITMEALNNIKYIKFSNLESYYSERFLKVSRRFSNSVAVQFVLNQIPKYAVELVAFGGVILISIITLVSAMEVDGEVPSTFFPLLSAYALSAYKLQPAVQSIFNGIVSLRYGQVALNNLFQSLNQISAKVYPKAFEPGNKKITFNRAIQCKNISFRYSSENPNVIDNLEFEIGRGSSVGIVGTTGSGKSTLINIMLGLLKPTTGKIFVDGTEISESNTKNWQDIIGYVPQNVTLVDASIHENIAFGVDFNDIDFEYAKYCGRVAMLEDNFFTSAHYKNIGDAGSKISGGQRQRIGIARALYKKPKLLVLDEATSGLDPNTEKRLLSAISELSDDLSILMVTHRYSNLKICDVVFEMRGGKLRKWHGKNE